MSKVIAALAAEIDAAEKDRAEKIHALGSSPEAFAAYRKADEHLTGLLWRYFGASEERRRMERHKNMIRGAVRRARKAGFR